jgi:DNA-directed RNA polymerase specialized sigma24 family protein
MKDDLYRDPLLRRLIEAVMRIKNVPSRDVEDAVQDVYEALFKWSQKKGAQTPADLRTGARNIAKKIGKKYWRKRNAGEGHNVGMTPDADEHGKLENPSEIELIDVSKVLTTINEAVAANAISDVEAAVLTALAEETTLAEHAEETQRSPEAVRKTAERARKKIIEFLHARGVSDVGIPRLAAGVAIAILLLMVLTGRIRAFRDDPVARDKPTPDAGETLVSPPRETPEQVLARAQEQRDKAAAELVRAELAYKRMNWQDCIQRVEDAKKLDPTVGDSPALLHECAREQEDSANAKSPRKRR